MMMLLIIPLMMKIKKLTDSCQICKSHSNGKLHNGGLQRKVHVWSYKSWSISHFLLPLTSMVWSSQLFTDRAFSPTDSWGQWGYLQFLRGRRSSLAPLMESSPASCRSQLCAPEPITMSCRPPAGPQINSDLKCVWEQQMERSCSG